MTLLPLPQLLLLVCLVTSAEDSFQVISFRKSRTIENGPVKCALGPANETILQSSLQDCSLACARDGDCDSFNFREAETCELYNYRVKVVAPVAACNNYQVAHDTFLKIFLLLLAASSSGSGLMDTSGVVVLQLLLLLLLLVAIVVDYGLDGL